MTAQSSAISDHHRCQSIPMNEFACTLLHTTRTHSHPPKPANRAHVCVCACVCLHSVHVLLCDHHRARFSACVCAVPHIPNIFLHTRTSQHISSDRRFVIVFNTVRVQHTNAHTHTHAQGAFDSHIPNINSDVLPFTLAPRRRRRRLPSNNTHPNQNAHTHLRHITNSL